MAANECYESMYIKKETLISSQGLLISLPNATPHPEQKPRLQYMTSTRSRDRRMHNNPRIILAKSQPENRSSLPLNDNNTAAYSSPSRLVERIYCMPDNGRLPDTPRGSILRATANPLPDIVSPVHLAPYYPDPFSQRYQQGRRSTQSFPGKHELYRYITCSSSYCCPVSK